VDRLGGSSGLVCVRAYGDLWRWLVVRRLHHERLKLSARVDTLLQIVKATWDEVEEAVAIRSAATVYPATTPKRAPSEGWPAGQGNIRPSTPTCRVKCLLVVGK
jgi:hypothetical protein